VGEIVDKFSAKKQIVQTLDYKPDSNEVIVG
jgi:hypothetical protein